MTHISKYNKPSIGKKAECCSWIISSTNMVACPTRVNGNVSLVGDPQPTTKTSLFPSRWEWSQGMEFRASCNKGSRLIISPKTWELLTQFNYSPHLTKLFFAEQRFQCQSLFYTFNCFMKIW